MEYIIKPRAARKIYTFYGNVAKKYRHTYGDTNLSPVTPWAILQAITLRHG